VEFTSLSMICIRRLRFDCFEFKKVRGNIEDELSGVYIFEYDLYTKVKISYDDIEHIVLTEITSSNEVDDKYNLKELYDE